MAVTNVYLVRDLADEPYRLKPVWEEFFEAKRTVKSFMQPLSGNTAGCTCAECRRTRRRQFDTERVFAVFAEAVEKVSGERIKKCFRCKMPEWEDNSHTDRTDNVVCSSCYDRYRCCARCSDFDVNDATLTYAEGDRYCQPCLNENFTWCADCEAYYADGNADDHLHGEVPACTCSPQPLQFTIPANSHGVLTQDERLLVELPQGFITDEAVEAVFELLWCEQFDATIPQPDYYERAAYYKAAEQRAELSGKLKKTVFSLERMWQTKRGNYTRRLSKALHDEMQVKLDPGLLSKVGSVVRQHTPLTNQWHVEFTRDVNGPASAFANEGSCWWGGESEGLCALKHWGGLAMRTYASEEQGREFPSGRAWVQPMNENMQPTSDILNAHAYVVYNGYGNLEGYTAARLVAYLASRTYRKIEFGAPYQYINSCSGYLIADQETCDKYNEVYIRDLSYHQKVTA